MQGVLPGQLSASDNAARNQGSQGNPNDSEKSSSSTRKVSDDDAHILPASLFFTTETSAGRTTLDPSSERPREEKHRKKDRKKVRIAPEEGDDLKHRPSHFSHCSARTLASRGSTWSQSNMSIMHSMGPRSLNSITFQDGVTVRGIDLRLVMRRVAHIFSSPVGDDSSSGAEEVPCIRTFISHNWSVPRFQKFLQLIMAHNSCRAALTAIVASLICCALVAFGQLPVYESVKFQGGDIVERSMYSLILSTHVFIAMLLFGHEVDCCSRHPVFLDKCCISQSDPDLKRKGIESIGAFLFHCERMVVLYSDVYLQRLWTVFELGLFLTLRQGAPIVVVPVFMPTLVIGGFFVCSLRSIGIEVLQMRSVVEHYPDTNRSLQYALFFSVLMLTGVLAGYVLRRWARDNHNIRRYAREFSIRKAQCADEKDRDLVQGNVIAYLRDLTIVELSQSDDEVLSTFDRLVAKTVPRVLEKSLGHIGIPYSYIIMAQLSVAMLALEALSVDFRNEEPIRVCSLNLALEFLLLAGVIPLLLAALAWILSFQLQLTGLPDACYSYGSSLSAVACMFLASYGGQALRDDAKSDDGALALFVLASAVLLAATFCVYGRRWLLLMTKRLCSRSDGFISLH